MKIHFSSATFYKRRYKYLRSGIHTRYDEEEIENQRTLSFYMSDYL